MVNLNRRHFVGGLSGLVLGFNLPGCRTVMPPLDTTVSLGEAIADGGTTLRDFVGGDGRPGYFRQQLAVYGRGGQPCRGCGNRLREVRLAQRTTVYCPSCQR